MSGGGDGATRIWNASRLRDIQSRPLPLAQSDQVPRLVAAVGTGYLIQTHQGVIFSRKMDSEEWVQLLHDERLLHGSVMDTDGDRTVIFGTRNGTVLILSIDAEMTIEQQKVVQLEESKIFSAHLVGNGQFLVCFDRGRLELRDLSPGNHPQPRGHFVLPEAKQRWPGCALVTDQVAIVGDREGSLHLFSIAQQVIDQFRSVSCDSPF